MLQQLLHRPANRGQGVVAGMEITPGNTVLVAGPRASRGMRNRLATNKAMNPQTNPELPLI